MGKPVLHLLTGPSACGKTELSLRWAERFGAEIICADSTTVYRGMDVGTAKPGPDERRRVRHHLLDVAEVSQLFDVSEFARQTAAAVQDIRSRGKEVLVVGGSGFYLKSFHAPVADEVGITDGLRAEIRELERKEGLPGMVRELVALNGADGVGMIDLMNPRRVSNALLRCRASGLSLARLLERFRALPEPFPQWEKRIVVLERDFSELELRAAERARLMLHAGLVEECRMLRDLGIESNPAAASAIGYRETLAFLRGEIPEHLLLDSISQATTRLIRKQLGWFRKQLPCHRLVNAANPGDPANWFLPA